MLCKSIKKLTSFMNSPLCQCPSSNFPGKRTNRDILVDGEGEPRRLVGCKLSPQILRCWPDKSPRHYPQEVPPNHQVDRRAGPEQTSRHDISVFRSDVKPICLFLVARGQDSTLFLMTSVLMEDWTDKTHLTTKYFSKCWYGLCLMFHFKDKSCFSCLRCKGWFNNYVIHF